MKGILFCIALLAGLVGCSTHGGSEGVRVSTRCRVHGEQLVRISGYTFRQGIVADPSWDYVRFMSEVKDQYLHTTSWAFSRRRSEDMSRPLTVTVCPRCDSEFDARLADYEKLGEAAKEERWKRYLAREVEGRR